MTRVLVVRLGSLGDLVHTLPAVAALRRAHPGRDIDWLVDATHRGFLELVPDVTAIVPLGGRSARAWIDARRALRERRYDAAVDFQGLLKSAALARLSGARRVIGFDRGALRERAAAPFYTERIEVGEGGHVIQKNLRLAAALGARPGAPEFPIAEVDSAPARRAQAEVAGPYALLNPGAAWPNKRWPPDRFGRLARILRDRHGLASIVLWGPGEGTLARGVLAFADGAARLAPETSWRDVVALARGARLIVSGDTGPLHVAAAVGVPAVGLYGPTNPRRNGPWSADDVVISRHEACHCAYKRRCRLGADDWCLAAVSVEDVAAAADRRLGAAGTSP